MLLRNSVHLNCKTTHIGVHKIALQLIDKNNRYSYTKNRKRQYSQTETNPRAATVKCDA